VFSLPQSQFTLENNQGGKIILNYSFIAGDRLEIDYLERKVTLNGKDLAIAISLDTVWFDLKPGQVQLKASHSTALTYTERFY
jgi:phage-related protein